jgi:hypothetical protein
MPTPRLLIALLAALALLSTGCAGGGGGSESAGPSLAEYEAAVVNTRDRVDFALARITKAESQDEVLDRMDEAAVSIDAAASDLEDKGSPEEFEEETKQLTDSLHQLSVDLAAVAHDVRNQIVEAPKALNFESWDQANLALAALIGDGIDVKLIGRH